MARSWSVGRTRRGIRIEESRAAALVLGLALSACSPFDLDPPGRARVVLDGPAGRTMEVVTTTDFLPHPEDPATVDILSADTTRVTLPFAAEYDVELRYDRYRFYVQAAPVDEESVTVRMRIVIAGHEWYDETRDVQEHPHRFFYLR